jgi:phage protein D
MPDKAFELRCGGAPAPDLYPYVDHVEVLERVGGTSFAVRFRSTQGPNGEWSLLSDQRFAPFLPMGVSLGFTGAGGGPLGSSGGGLDTLVEGYVTGAEVSLTGSDVRFDVLGQDPWAVLDTEEKVLAWPDLSDSDIARQILAGAGIDADITPTSSVRQADDVLVVQRGTDASMLRELARRNGYVCRFTVADGRTGCRFGPPQLDGSPQPELAVRFGTGSNLRTFEAALDGRRPLTIRAAQVGALSRDIVEAEASDPSLRFTGRTGLADLAAPGLARAAVPLRAHGTLLLAATPGDDPAELNRHAQAARDEAAWFVEARGEVNADAYGHVLRAGRTVLVKGAGSRHSGVYYVTSVVHRMRPDGEYTQRFEARRTAVGLDGSESFGGASGGLPFGL